MPRPAIVTSALLEGRGQAGAGLLGIAVAHGLALAIAVTAAMNVSGGHINPAVTIALWMYKRITGDRAIAYEAFLRGWTEGEVAIREYGARAIYRQAILNRPWLWAELVLGYSWPRELLIEERDGSLTVGLGVEIRFDRELVDAFGTTDEPAGQ